MWSLQSTIRNLLEKTKVAQADQSQFLYFGSTCPGTADSKRLQAKSTYSVSLTDPPFCDFNADPTISSFHKLPNQKTYFKSKQGMVGCLVKFNDLSDHLIVHVPWYSLSTKLGENNIVTDTNDSETIKQHPTSKKKKGIILQCVCDL